MLPNRWLDYRKAQTMSRKVNEPRPGLVPLGKAYVLKDVIRLMHTADARLSMSSCILTKVAGIASGELD